MSAFGVYFVMYSTAAIFPKFFCMQVHACQVKGWDNCVSMLTCQHVVLRTGESEKEKGLASSNEKAS